MAIYIKTEDSANLLSSNSNAIISDQFSETKSYTEGDYCIYDNTLYQFTSDHAAGEWTGEDVEATTVTAELSELNLNTQSIADMTATTLLSVESHDRISESYTIESFYNYKKILFSCFVSSATATQNLLLTPKEIATIYPRVYRMIGVFVYNTGYSTVNMSSLTSNSTILTVTVGNTLSDESAIGSCRIIGFK